MRIAYGVFGYGRGHASRTEAVLPDLRRRHEVLLLAGGDAWDALHHCRPIVRIPAFGYAYASRGKRSSWRTLVKNAPLVADLLRRGPRFDSVCRVLRDFRPDVVVSDAEPWTHHAADHLGIPRIGFDHFGLLACCRIRARGWDRLWLRRDVWVYRLLTGYPDRVIVSSFYPAPPKRAGVRVVGPLLREEVRRLEPRRGGYLLVYFNQGRHQFTPAVERALKTAGVPARVYGAAREGRDGNLEYKPPGVRSFLGDLAGCRAVISTAGNQLVGEALYLGKPLLVVPEACVEQRLNADAVERLGVGRKVRFRDFRAETIRDFLARADTYAAGIGPHVRDGRQEALAALETFLAELAPRAGVRPERHVVTPCG